MLIFVNPVSLKLKKFYNPEAEAQMSYAHAALNYKTEREPVLIPHGYCERKEKNVIF